MSGDPNLLGLAGRQPLYPPPRGAPHPLAGTRPNILMILTDAQRCDTIGAYGNPRVRTPRTDKLAAEGVRFDRFYVPNAICQPARASLVTGQMPSSHGVRANGINLPEAIPTLPALLAAAGYRTACFGKLHLSSWGAPDPAASPEAQAAWAAGRALPANYRGFGRIGAVHGHSEFVYGDYRDWLDRSLPEGFALLQFDRAVEPPSGALCTWTSALPAEAHHSTWVADRSIEFLAESDPSPFFLVCSFPDPHMSFCPPAPYAARYRAEDMPLPLWRPGELDRMPPHFRAYWEGTGYCREFFASGEMNMRPARDHTPAQWQDMIAHYWGQVSLIDDQLGRILDALAARGLEDGTVVLFLSDHGALMGDHGMHMHGPFHYEPQIRIPCLWRWPGRFAAGHVPAGLAGTIDVAPTLLDPAGVEIPFAMQGESLLAALAGGPAPHRAMVVECDDEHFGPFSRTLVTGRWKLTAYADAPWGEMFDLAEDADEFRNLWDEPAHAARRSVLREALLAEMLRLAPRRERRLAVYA